MMAVLEGGIREYCAVGGRCAEGEDWVRSDCREAFSFAVVCETLGLDQVAVRQALVRMKEQGELHSQPSNCEDSETDDGMIRVTIAGGQ